MRLMTALRVTALWLGVTVLAAACAPRSGSVLDGVWTGNDSTRQFDFNSPLNWSPQGVPTGTATISAPAPPAPFVRFTQPTTLAAINLTGALGLTVDQRTSVTLNGGGLSICCDARGQINGVLTGNVNLGDRPTQPNHQVGGGGTINGNITQTSGALSPGNGPDSRVLAVNGGYVMGQKAGLIIDVWPPGATVLQLRGNASLSGALLINVNGGVPEPIPPFKVLTANAISGRFATVYVIGEQYNATVVYNANDVTVTLRRR
jgi:hypothetical protein